MRALLTKWRQFALCARGAAAPEYAVTLALILLVATSGIGLLNTTTGGLWRDSQSQLSRGLGDDTAKSGGLGVADVGDIDNKDGPEHK